LADPGLREKARLIPPAVVSGDAAEPRRPSRVLIWLIAALTAMFATYALKLTYSVTMPLALAFFLAVLVYPVQHWLALRLPRWLSGLSLVVAVVVVVAALAVVVGAIWLAGELMAPKLPQYADQLQQQWQAFRGWIGQLGLPLGAGAGEGAGGGQGDEDSGGGFLSTFLQTVQTFATTVLSFLSLMVLALFFMILMLGDVGRWRRAAENAFPDGGGRAAIDVVRIVAHKVRRFLLVRALIGMISGTVAGLWLWFLGVDLALVWGLLFFVLNFIPNIGSIIAAIPPVLIALLTLGPTWALVALGGLMVNEQVTGNFLDPKIQGRNLDIAPLVVLSSVIFWTWIWGVPGALLAVPLTVTAIIACTKVAALRPLALLLSGSGSVEEMEQKLHAGH
jgi:AI-2 transport protein TqsA